MRWERERDCGLEGGEKERQRNTVNFRVGLSWARKMAVTEAFVRCGDLGRIYIHGGEDSTGVTRQGSRDPLMNCGETGPRVRQRGRFHGQLMRP